MTIKYYTELEQGSEEWFAVRCGRLTASEMKNIITPKTLEPVKSKEAGKECAHLYELLAQRVNNFVELDYVSEDMLRGMTDEVDAKILYEKHYGKIEKCGFITNDKWGFTIGYSPDFLVGADGLGECKSRKQAYQMSTVLSRAMPDDFRIQVQTGFLVSERKWLDFISYSAGTPFKPLRIYPDEKIMTAIIDVASVFEGKLQKARALYDEIMAEGKWIPTIRKPPEGEIQIDAG